MSAAATARRARRALRVTGGTLAGRRARVPDGPARPIRPAMDRMRESVFACLGDLTGLSFLDLFSGSGIIALEAASRGAAYIEAVEKDERKRSALLENAAISPTRVRCRFMAVELFIRRARRAFDVVFCDPPFPYRHRRDLLETLAASPLIGPGGRLLVHRPREDDPGEPPAGLAVEDRREYGRSIVDFYRRVEGDGR